jgi:hypothetical protein
LGITGLAGNDAGSFRGERDFDSLFGEQNLYAMGGSKSSVQQIDTFEPDSRRILVMTDLCGAATREGGAHLSTSVFGAIGANAVAVVLIVLSLFGICAFEESTAATTLEVG